MEKGSLPVTRRLHRLRPPPMAETSAAPPPLSSESTKKKKQQKEGKRKSPKQKQPSELLMVNFGAGFLSLEEFDEADYGLIGGLPDLDGAVKETSSSLRNKEEERKKEKRRKTKKKMKKKESEEKRGETETPIEVNTQDAPDSNGVVDDIAEELHLDDDVFYTWKELRLHPLLMKSICKLGFKEPTPIQKACIPAAAHQGKDVIGAAETGSGKTLAFGLPILQRLLEEREKATKVLEKEVGVVKEGPLRALIVAPTRELALQAVDRFQENDDAVLVATDVAARGLDIPGIRTVIHYQLPHSAEVYIHRSGRTARASADGCCIALISPGDKTKFFALCNSMSKLACRDYPHPRHLCARFPFSSTPHENYCEMCHCYVCDSPAPCIYWSNGHCHSTDKQGNWKTLRTAFKLRNKAGPHPQKPPDITLSMTRPLQNTVSTRRRHPISLPIMSSRPSTLRPCSWTQVPTRTPISQRQQSHPIIFSCRGQRLGDRQTRQQLPFSGTHYPQREKRGVDNLGAQIMQPHAKFRRIGTTENSTPIDNTNQLQQVISHHNRLYGDSTQRLQCPPATLVEESMKKWQEILEGVAADLGVADSGNERSTEAQLVSSQPIACDQFLSQTNASQSSDIDAHSAPQVTDLDSLDIRSWSYTNATAHDITEHNPIEHSKSVTVQSSNPSVSGERHWKSFLDVADQEPVLGAANESGLVELDPDGLLYDFDSTWSSSTTQV